MIEEVRKKLETLKESCKDKVKAFCGQKKIDRFKQKIQNYFFTQKEEHKNFYDMLFLIRYSLKYKNVCIWPSYNDLLILNLNVNDNFKNLIKQNDAFFENFKKTLIEGEKQSMTEGFDYIEKSNCGKNDNIIDAMPLEKQNNIWNETKKRSNFVIHFNEDVTYFNRMKLQCFMYLILNNYRVRTLLDSLSALNRPINVIYINCPNNKQPKSTLCEKIANLFTSKNTMNDIATSKRGTTELNASKSQETRKETSKITKRKIETKCVSCSQEEQLYLDNSALVTEKKENYIAGYNPINNTIWICANNVNNAYKLKYILLHELMHAFDFARANIDVYNCHHIACTEIRAYNMSNQCGYLNSKYFKGSQNVFERLKTDQIKNTEKNKCIYNNTYSSLYQFKPCKNNAEQYINDVFQKCASDYWPFMCAPERDSKYKPSKIMHKDH